MIDVYSRRIIVGLRVWKAALVLTKSGGRHRNSLISVDMTQNRVCLRGAAEQAHGPRMATQKQSQLLVQNVLRRAVSCNYVRKGVTQGGQHCGRREIRITREREIKDPVGPVASERAIEHTGSL